MGDSMTDAAALALVGSLRDLRVQLEISNGLAVQERADLAALREELRRLSDRVVCLEDGVGQAAAAWSKLVDRLYPDGLPGDPVA